MWKAREQKKNKAGGLIPVDFKTHCRNQECDICIQLDPKINRTEQNRAGDPHIYGQLIIDKGTRLIQMKSFEMKG